MAKKYLFSTVNIIKRIEQGMVHVQDIGLTKWDLLAIIIEYIEYSKNSTVNTSISDYLRSSWLIDERNLEKLTVIIETMMSDIHIYSPELFSVLDETKNLKLIHYDKHTFMVENI